jgi:hypothetical protein
MKGRVALAVVPLALGRCGRRRLALERGNELGGCRLTPGDLSASENSGIFLVETKGTGLRGLLDRPAEAAWQPSR